MSVVGAILLGTSWWVFMLLALLVALGISQLRPRAVRLPRILIAPAVFLGWGLIALWIRAGTGSAAPWLLALIIGVLVGWQTTSLDGLRADRQRGLIYLPGGWTTLVASLAVFFVD